MIEKYDRFEVFIPKNKKNELIVAKRLQKKLLIVKILYGYFIISVALFTFQNELEKINMKFGDIVFFMLIVGVVLFILSILLNLILGICPYCHNFQSLNGKSVGIEQNSLFSYSTGISPFIKYCNKCNAPLSPKSVEDVYKNRKS